MHTSLDRVPMTTTKIFILHCNFLLLLSLGGLYRPWQLQTTVCRVAHINERTGETWPENRTESALMIGILVNDSVKMRIRNSRWMCMCSYLWMWVWVYSPEMKEEKRERGNNWQFREERTEIIWGEGNRAARRLTPISRWRAEERPSIMPRVVSFTRTQAPPPLCLSPSSSVPVHLSTLHAHTCTRIPAGVLLSRRLSKYAKNRKKADSAIDIPCVLDDRERRKSWNSVTSVSFCLILSLIVVLFLFVEFF